jgi:coproporphyrinogen III oxidase-like Fe-S oxidoreductase
MNAGWPFADFQKTTGHDLRNEWADSMQKLAEQGNAVLEDERFRLTPKGLRFADAAAAEFLR